MKSRFSIPWRRGGCAATLLWMLATAPAYAATSCVSSLSDLKTALDLAQHAATTVEVVQGTYDLKTTVWGGNSATLHDGSSVLGGYTGSTCSGRNIDVNNTTFTDSDTTSAAFQVLGDATIEGITFNLPYGVQVESGSDGGGELLFRRDVFTGTTKSPNAALYILWGPAPNAVIRIVDTLIHDNSSTTADSAAVKIIEEDGSPDVELVNNTIMDNGGQMYGVYVDEFDSTDVYAYNNIFYGNGSTDFKVTGSPHTLLVDNVIGHFSYPTPNNAPVGTTQGDPQLDANFKPIEAPPSNVINSGTDSVVGGLPSTDLPGRNRDVGSEPDRGAYESSINNSTFQTVTNNNDSGPGSLRAAILSSNANGADGSIIQFQIGSSCGPQVITLQTALPAISTPAHIFGYTQTGASKNTLTNGDNANICIILDGATHSIANGLVVAANATSGVAIEGLAFSGFSFDAIDIGGSSGHFVNGNRTGGKLGTHQLAANGYGVVIAQKVTGVQVGSSDPGDRNQFGDVLNNAVQINAFNEFIGQAASGNSVVNNYIGVVYDGTTPTASPSYTTGIYVGGPGNTVQGNVVDGATKGIWLDTSDANTNTVKKNIVGVNAFGGVASNGTGIYVDLGAGDNAVTNNTVAHNTASGVVITGSGLGNNLLDTLFFGNTGLAIDLGGDGVTQNDNDSTQSTDQPNRKQNFPTLNSAMGTAVEGHIQGSLVSTPGSYTVQLFQSQTCNASGYGEGELKLATSTVTINSGGLTDGQGTAQFDIDALGLFGAGYGVITATATDSSGNTSEFSACVNYVNDTIFSDGFES
jgi:trimeric autotransporter adhesin